MSDRQRIEREENRGRYWKSRARKAEAEVERVRKLAVLCWFEAGGGPTDAGEEENALTEAAEYFALLAPAPPRPTRKEERWTQTQVDSCERKRRKRG